MRDILFKAKRVDNGMWVYGGYVADPEGRHRIYWKPFKEASQNTYHFVDPETVCQCTDRVDSTGVKIFDGDIWEREGFVGVVEFRTCQWVITAHKRSKCTSYPSFYSNAKTGIVIGSIHDEEG